MFRRVVRTILLLVLMTGAFARPAAAQDLPVAADAGHLWLVIETGGADGEAVQVYHRAPGDDPIRLRALEPIPGRLRPGGIAAGGGRLVLVLDDGRVITRTPHQPPMTTGWSYRAGTLPGLPDGCALRSLAATEHHAWALVRVDTPESLAALEPTPAGRSHAAAQDRLNLVLGLPPGIELHGNYHPPAPAPDDETDSDSAPDPDADTEDNDDAATDADPAAGEAADPNAQPPAIEPLTDAPAEPDTEVEPEAQPEAEPEPEPIVLPVYRLVRTGANGWQPVALPEEFGVPRQAALVVRDASDERPAIVAEAPRGFGRLFVYLPVEDEAWAMLGYSVPASNAWSATGVGGQVVVATERERGTDIVWADVYLLRARRAMPLATLGVTTAGLSRWRLIGIDGQAALLARPGPRMQGEPPTVALLGGKRVGLDTGKETDLEWYLLAQRSRWEHNADWMIQVGAFMVAMILMALFWKRTPRDREVDLPANIHLVPWPRRLTATLIDLIPGFWIVGLVYGLGWDAIILQHWPGTPITKPPVAMEPGCWVIAITVFHTTAFEFITARSIGKWLTGTYVSDFRGRAAPPGASFVRAVMRLFDLIAWLLLLLPLISPYRQRLGDILARTLVVMRDDPGPEEKAKEQHGD